MVTGSNEVFIDESVSSDGSIISDIKALPPGSKGLLVSCIVSNRVDGSYQIALEHSPDGVNFAPISSTALLSADGIEHFEITTSTFHIFRATLTSSSVTSGADVKCLISYTPNKL